MVAGANEKHQGGKQMKNTENLPVFYVGIGASAGGLEAIDAFFEKMPTDTGMAFILVQHLSPDHKSLMVEILSKKTDLPVHRAENGATVQANAIYLIPPKANLTIFHGKLIVTEQERHGAHCLPIDIFFRSLADDQGSRAISVILSGTGSDGMRGVRAIKEHGGIVMVQDIESAKFDGMPRNAISTGLADFILPAQDMARELEGLLHHPVMGDEDYSKIIANDQENLTSIFALLREKSGVDFTFYKPSTFSRRLERRMAVNQIQQLSAYVRHLDDHPAEITSLYRELLIGVTNFFRDEKVWEVLRNQVIPEIIKDSKPDEQLRFWVTACSTGEEAYSLAITIRECLEEEDVHREVKIFATDLDRNAIASAAAGIYAESVAEDIPPFLLSKYFIKREERFQVTPKIREMVVFAPHNLLKDPPFRRMKLVSCRNLLIYLQPVLQQKALALFHFSLNTKGILLLGTSETTGGLQDYYKSIDARNKIYESTGKLQSVPGEFFRTEAGSSAPPKQRFESPVNNSASFRVSRDNLLARMLHTIGSKYAPVTIFVSDKNDILHTVGSSERFLRIPAGHMTNNILKLVPEDLAIPLATGLQYVKKHNKETAYNNIHLRDEEGETLEVINMSVVPVPGRSGSENINAIFLDKNTHSSTSISKDIEEYDIDKEMHQRIEDLEQELQYTRENLQSTIEQLETSNEELQAANEELLASNEELQSTNEELQSVNEELYTVNSEYQAKIQELTELNNDIDNLLRSTEIGTVFLDEDLCIRKFTPSAAEVLKVLDHDIGRPISHLTHTFDNINIVDIATEVLRTALPDEREVTTRNGKTYLMRTLPYHVDKRTVKGTVITFIDITDLKQAVADLEESEARFRLFFDTTPELVQVTKFATGEIVAANKIFSEAMGYDPEEIIGKSSTEIAQWTDPDERKEFLDELQTKGVVRNRKGTFINSEGETLPWQYSARAFVMNGEKHILSIARDISDFEEMHEDLIRSEAFVDVALQVGRVALWDVNLATGEVTTQGLLNMLGFDPDEPPTDLGKWMSERVHQDDQDMVQEKIDNCISGESTLYSTDHRMIRKGGDIMWVTASGTLFTDPDGVKHLIGSSIDVTPRYDAIEQKD